MPRRQSFTQRYHANASDLNALVASLQSLLPESPPAPPNPSDVEAESVGLLPFVLQAESTPEESKPRYRHRTHSHPRRSSPTMHMVEQIETCQSDREKRRLYERQGLDMNRPSVTRPVTSIPNAPINFRTPTELAGFSEDERREYHSIPNVYQSALLADEQLKASDGCTIKF